MNDFVHLHLHSQYSVLDGAIRLGDMMPRLKEYGMTSVAVTDHGNMFGAIDFYKKATKAGIKPILGVEAYVAEGDRRDKVRGAYHLILLARNETGYANLRKLVSYAYLEGHYYHPRMDLGLLKAHSEGLIALSACLGGQIAQAVMKGQNDRARELAITYRDTFEPGMFFLEVQPNGLPEQRTVNAVYRQIGRELNIPLCATNDCHYLEQKDARAHEILMCVQTGKTLDDPTRVRHDTDAYWLRPGTEMWRLMKEDFADALENTVRIAEMCNVKLHLDSPQLPTYRVPEDQTIDSFLLTKAQEGLEARFREFAAIDKSIDRALYQRRLDDELGVIQKMGFAGYFLIVQDFINWAKDQDIPVGPGRGSGAGSLAAYALRITDLDPLPYGLLFERFLNPERVSMPDFDVDFCMNRRNEVIDYVTRKYGRENVGQIATFGALKARGVIKDVGRVLGLTFAETDKISKLVPEVLNIELADAIKQEPRLQAMYDAEPRMRELLDIALALEGLHRSVGMHAAGIVIGDKPLWEYCPVFKGAKDEIVTQFAKDEVEAAGLVKFDFLGLKTLTVVKDAVRMVNRGRAAGDLLDLDRLGLSDLGVYELISRGDTEGVFQLESSGFQELLKKLKPDKFEDIVAAVALYRPGPLNSGMLDDFIDRKHGRQKIAYPHDSLRQILEETYGVIVYQEQVMQIAQVLAGFTLGGADLLRRAMGKKKADVMAQQRAVFVDGAAQTNNVPAAQAGEIFDLMEKFAEYGFNKSHSAAYALITYHTGYLKAHHRVEFMAAVLSNDKDNSEKVSRGIRTARKMGIEVLPPSANRSVADFDAVDGAILFGMAGIRGVGENAVTAIIEARNQDGAFRDLFDFCERVDLKRVNKKVIEALVKSGAFDFCGEPRARMLAAIDIASDRAQQAQKDRSTGQSSLFDLFAATSPSAVERGMPADLQRVTEWPQRKLLAFEKDSLGFYVSGHPLDRFADQIEQYATACVEDLRGMDNYARITLCGIQTAYKARPLKSGDGRMGIITFEDQTGSVEVIAMGEELNQYEPLLTSDEPLLLRGTLRVEREEERVNVSVRLGFGRPRRGEPESTDPPVVLLADVRTARARAVEIGLMTTAVSVDRMTALGALLREPRHGGLCEAWIKLTTADACDVTLKMPDVKVSPSDELFDELRRVFAGEADVRVH